MDLNKINMCKHQLTEYKETRRLLYHCQNYLYGLSFPFDPENGYANLCHVQNSKEISSVNDVVNDEFFRHIMRRNVIAIGQYSKSYKCPCGNYFIYFYVVLKFELKSFKLLVYDTMENEIYLRYSDCDIFIKKDLISSGPQEYKPRCQHFNVIDNCIYEYTCQCREYEKIVDYHFGKLKSFEIEHLDIEFLEELLDLRNRVRCLISNNNSNKKFRQCKEMEIKGILPNGSLDMSSISESKSSLIQYDDVFAYGINQKYTEPIWFMKTFFSRTKSANKVK